MTFTKPVSLFLAASLVACGPFTKPPTRELIEVRGTPYDRGLQHGTQLRSKVRSFYTTLLTNSLFPYLSREQPDIASFLPEYAAERYQNGNFAYELMLDSAKNIERSLNRATREELQGIADGSGMTYDQILVLNTFFDTVLAVRGVALAIRLARAPLLKSVEFVGADTDGVDNDSDGMIDEAGEGRVEPYIPELYGLAVELAPAAAIRLVLTEVDGVDPATVRIFLGNQLYTADSPEMVMTELSPTDLQVTLTPSTPLEGALTTTLVIGGGDKKLITVPLPARASFMRDEELAFTTRGAGLSRRDVRRPALTDGRTRPPPIAIGARGSMTVGGMPFIAHHFSLLDANTAHKHTIAIRHVPETGPAFVTVGWAGIVYGLSGMSDRGVGYACDPADTLDNSVVGSVLEQVADIARAKLLAKGMPIGFLGRKILEQATDAASAREVVAQAERVYGWTCVFADKTGGLEAIEVDSDIFNDGTRGTFPLSTTELDATGRRYASTSDDDFVLGSNFVKNVPDIATLNVAGQRIVPQRQWSGFFYRSRRAVDGVKGRLEAAKGTIDAAFLEQLVADPQFVDQSDSMNAVVLDFEHLQVRSAMGEVPATNAPFEVTEVRP
ncbi:MAG: hypothetical protein Q8L48_26350 [Archangium sp.]|nr:hypothetical protein [Archangium sp.]